MSTGMAGVTSWAAEAGEDLSNALFTFATVHADGKIYQANSGEVTIGLIVEGAAAGGFVSVQCDGIGKVTLGATLSAGTEIMSDNSGAAVQRIPSPNDLFSAGRLLTGGNSGEVVSILLS